MNDRQLKKIIKEELIKEMDLTTGVAIAGGAYLAYKALAFLVAVVGGVKKGIQAGLDEHNLRLEVLGSMVIDPEIRPMLKKLKDNQEILDMIARGDLDEAAKQIKESGVLTPEEMQVIEGKFKRVKTHMGLRRTANRLKNGTY